jgi:hypothetical protein
MGGRAVEGTGLENRQGATPRGFESHPIRHNMAGASARSPRPSVLEPNLAPPWSRGSTHLTARPQPQQPGQRPVTGAPPARLASRGRRWDRPGSRREPGAATEHAWWAPAPASRTAVTRLIGRPRPQRGRASGLRSAHAMYWPPLAESVEPVMKPASSPARNTTQRATSSGSPRRPAGISGRIPPL